MITTTPFYISPRGGSITCFRSDSGRIFRSCSSGRCVNASDLLSAKAYLDNLELSHRLNPSKVIDPPVQRKTTLKWNSDGELSAVDMARILDRISNPELTQCDLVGDSGDSSFEYSNTSPQETLPTSAWIP